MRIALACLLAATLAIPASAQSDVSPEVREFHERMLVLDTHLDIPSRWDDGAWDFSERHRYEWDGTQTDLPRMEEGGLDGGLLGGNLLLHARDISRHRLQLRFQPKPLEIAVLQDEDGLNHGVGHAGCTLRPGWRAGQRQDAGETGNRKPETGNRNSKPQKN